MAVPATPPASTPLSWPRIGSIAVFAIVALLTISLDAWLLVDLTERDPRAIPHFPLGARFLQGLTMLACLVSPFMLLGLILIRERAFGYCLGFLVALASTFLGAATTIYARSSAARVYFATLPNETPSFLFDSLTFTFLAGLMIVAICKTGGNN